MMELHYDIVEEKYFLNGKIRISYGLVACVAKNDDDISTIVATVSDVTCDREKIERLVRNCNEMRLSLIHFNDAIEDFLAE